MATENVRYLATRKATLVGALANILLAILKIVFGVIGGSQALVADGIHSFSDLLTDLLVILAAKFANVKADSNHPYGHERIETAATVALAILLVMVGGVIAYDAIHDLINHQYGVIPKAYVLWVAVLSIVVNEMIYRYTRRVAQKINSDILYANAVHSRSDAASSLIVLIGVLGSLCGLVYLDAIAAIVVGIFIIKMGIQIGWQNISELVDTGVDAVTLAAIKKVIANIPGVCAIHMLRTRKMAGRIMVDVHIIVPAKISVSEGHHISEHVLRALYDQVENIQDVTVHIDSEDDEIYSECAVLPLRETLLPELKKVWQNLVDVEQIQNIDLHFGQGKIEVWVTLPHQLLYGGKSSSELTQEFQKRALSVPNIAAVRLLFS
jgi:cation diffusion facilitator family transporter